MNTVLIADDHRFFRSGVEAALKSCGLQVLASVGDGAAALSAIESEDPEIVLLDIRMPILDGVSMLEQLRAKRDKRPVIVLTAELRDEDLVRLMKANVNSIVFKHEPEECLCNAIKLVQGGNRHFSNELLEKAMRLLSQATGESPLDSLSDKERRIAMEVAQGRKNRDIGVDLGVTSVKVV